jgi:putative redox protein
MPSELSVQAVHQGGMHFVATARGHALSMDYPLQGSETVGPTPLETLLASLAACAGGALVALLKRSGQAYDGLDVHVRGQRRDEHPTIVTEIALEFVLRGAGLDEAVVARAIAMAEERICPVWAMLKGGTAVKSSYRIVAP